MARTSAGLLMYRRRDDGVQVFLVHPGGPYWQNKDAGSWTIPKGEIQADENGLTAARREFAEETGHEPTGEFIELAPITQKGGKTVRAWAIDGDLDPASIRSNTFEMQWPPRSGHRRSFPEVDRAAWFDPVEAKRRINPAQAALIDQLVMLLRGV